MFPFISWQLQVVIKLFSFSKKAKNKARLVLTGWEYKKSLYFRFCFYATIPLQHKRVLPLICTSCSVLHLCLLDCFLFMSVCEIKSHFWTVFFVLRYVSFSKFFTVFFSLFCDGAWMTFCLLCDLFFNHPVSSFFLLGSCWAVRYLSPFKIRFPFLTSQVVLNCFYVSYMGRKTGDSICLCSLFLCSADFADSDFPDSVLTACGRALWITYWYFLNRYLHFPAQGHLLKLSLNCCMQ